MLKDNKCNYNDILMRTSRRWQLALSDKLNFSITSNSEKNIKVKGLSFLEYLKRYNKKSIFPSIEWLVDLTPKNHADKSLFIESGSRLYNTNRDYVIYVENGLGLYSYNTKKINFINKFLVSYLISKKNLKGFVFYSDASEIAFRNIFKNNETALSKSLGVIYPYTSDSYYRRHDKLKYRVGFCSSNFYLKGGLEVVELAKRKPEIRFDIITNIKDIDDRLRKNTPDNVKFYDFNFSDSEFKSLARDSWDIYLHPTFFDTVPLVPIEMMKCGLPIIVSDTFSLSEYVSKWKTGVVIDNPSCPFDSSFLPRNKGYLGDVILKLSKNKTAADEGLIDSLDLAIDEIYNNYSFYQSLVDDFVNNSDFSEEVVLMKWEELLNRISKD